MADNRSRGREHRWVRRHHLRRRRGPGGPLCLDIGRNTYGGFDLYAGEGPCPPGSPSYPPCNRARVVSFDRPFASGAGASDFLTNEYPLVAWAEEHGLDVTYASDVTVDAHPGFVLQHRALVSLDHDEVWTYSERLAVQRAEQQGVNVMFLGSAAVLRHARLQASPLGADQEEVDYRDSAEDPLAGSGNPMQVTGNTWSSPPTNWPEIGLVGELYSGYLLPDAAPAPFVVYDPSAWIFRGTGLRAGSEVPGVVASDIDHLAPAASTPAGLQVLGHSPVSLKVSYTNQGSWGGETYSDMTYYSDPTSHAGVFDSGTVHWVTTLTPCGQGTSSPCPAPMTQAITGNLFWLFGQGPAGRVDPSHPNWHSVRPSGS